VRLEPIPDGRGNWDHVVIRVPGGFVIDSKFLTEPAGVDGSAVSSLVVSR
jgi:hypothetical protein